MWALHLLRSIDPLSLLVNPRQGIQGRDFELSSGVLISNHAVQKAVSTDGVIVVASVAPCSDYTAVQTTAASAVT